jgi:hypothetical protein
MPRYPWRVVNKHFNRLVRVEVRALFVLGRLVVLRCIPSHLSVVQWTSDPFDGL